MFQDDKGNVVLILSKDVGFKESNGTELLAILEVLLLFSSSFQDTLILESIPQMLIPRFLPIGVLGGFFCWKLYLYPPKSMFSLSMWGGQLIPWWIY